MHLHDQSEGANLYPRQVVLIEGPLCPASFGDLGHTPLEVSADGGLGDDGEGMSNSRVFLFQCLSHDNWVPGVHDQTGSSGVSHRPLLRAEGQDGCRPIVLAEYAAP